MICEVSDMWCAWCQILKGLQIDTQILKVLFYFDAPRSA
jgi:hypothetical protein